MSRLVPLLALVTFALSSCARPTTSPNGSISPGAGDSLRSDVVTVDGIEYRGEILVMESFPVQLAGKVTITNRGGSSRTVVFPDGCVALLRAYHPGEPGPVWDQASEVACTMALVEVTLAPGESRNAATATASAHDVLDEGLPDGKYRMTIYLRPDQGTVEIDGGTVDLAIPR